MIWKYSLSMPGSGGPTSANRLSLITNCSSVTAPQTVAISRVIQKPHAAMVVSAETTLFPNPTRGRGAEVVVLFAEAEAFRGIRPTRPCGEVAAESDRL